MRINLAALPKWECDSAFQQRPGQTESRHFVIVAEIISPDYRVTRFFRSTIESAVFYKQSRRRLNVMHTLQYFCCLNSESNRVGRLTEISHRCCFARLRTCTDARASAVCGVETHFFLLILVAVRSVSDCPFTLSLSIVRPVSTECRSDQFLYLSTALSMLQFPATDCDTESTVPNGTEFQNY